MKIKKSFMAAMILCSVFLNVSAQEKGSARPCPRCDTGIVTTRTTRTYEHDETFPCVHYSHGRDRYKVYNEKTVKTCDTCSYTSTTENEDHVFAACNGYN